MIQRQLYSALTKYPLPVTYSQYLSHIESVLRGLHCSKGVSLLAMKFSAAVLTEGNPCLCCTWVGCKIILTILAAPITVQCWVAWWYGLGAPLHRLCYWHDYHSSILRPSDLSRSCRHTQGCETTFCGDLLALLCLGSNFFREITQILQMSWIRFGFPKNFSQIQWSISLCCPICVAASQVL